MSSMKKHIYLPRNLSIRIEQNSEGSSNLGLFSSFFASCAVLCWCCHLWWHCQLNCGWEHLGFCALNIINGSCPPIYLEVFHLLSNFQNHGDQSCCRFWFQIQQWWLAKFPFSQSSSQSVAETHTAHGAWSGKQHLMTDDLLIFQFVLCSMALLTVCIFSPCIAIVLLAFNWGEVR